MSADPSGTLKIPKPRPGGNREDTRGGSGVVSAVRGWIRRAFFDNAAIKFVSLVLAVTLFILVNTGQDVTIRLDVGIAYTMPEDRVLVADPLDKVTIEVRGSWRRTRRFDERELERVRIDLRERDDGVFEFTDGLFRLPHGLELVSVSPRAIRLTFEELDSRTVPVRVDWFGNPAEGFRVDRAITTPTQVTIRGGKSRVERVEYVETLGVSVTQRKESFKDIVPLAIPPGVSVEGPSQVEVAVDLTEELERRVLEAVKVEIRGSVPGVPVEGSYTVVPAEVEVVLLGSDAAIEAVLREPLFPYITVSPDEPGGRQLEVMLGVSGVGHEIRPRTVTLVRQK